MKLLVFKGSVIENNVPVAELSVSICLSRWPDSSSEIESLQKQVLYESSVGIAGLKDSSGLYTFGLRLCIAWLLKLMVSRNADTIIPKTSSDNGYCLSFRIYEQLSLSVLLTNLTEGGCVAYS